MNKIILIPLLIIGLVLISAFIISGVVLIERESGEKEITPQKEEIATPQLQVTKPIFGIYEVCSDVEECNLERGIEKIKAVGAKAIIVTVVDEEELKSVAYYPSKYLPLTEDVPNDYLKRIIEFAHKNSIKVYALINIPHNYWLERHPDWIAVWSDGQRADTYETDYFHRIIPPSRIITEEECRELLKNIIAEVINYGVDGIDINDNFQFSDQYLEETDITLYSSFDDFTIKKFEKDRNVTIQGNSPQEKAKYIENNPDIYEKWLRWRANEIIQLLRILKQATKAEGRDIPLRPHLLIYGEPYEYYGLDYQEIAKEVDVLYLMITPDTDKEKYFEIIKSAKDTQAKKIVVSTYLFREDDWSIVEKDKEKISKRMRWIKEAGADELYVYNFRLIEEGHFWNFISNF